jgi:hypothetical protein
MTQAQINEAQKLPGEPQKAHAPETGGRHKIERGWLGVRIQEVTPEIAKGFGLPNAKGALVADVTPGGPAEKGGIKQGDVIEAYDGHDIVNFRDLPLAVAATPMGRKADVKLWRNGRELTLTPTIVEISHALDTASGEVTAPRTGAEPMPNAGPDTHAHRADPSDDVATTSSQDQAYRNAQQEIRKYCTTATPPYCAEYQKQISEGLVACLKARGAAINIFNEIKPPVSFPPQMVLENMLNAQIPRSSLAMQNYTPGLSAVDLAAIIRLAISSYPAETTYSFSEGIYKRCVRDVELDD